MIKRNIPFSPPDISEAEINEVCEALRSGWITTGPRTKAFEKMLAEYCGTEKVVCLNSATAALELNLHILGIGEGDEVIVPAYTYTATASPVIHTGAKVVMADCSVDSLEPDYDKLDALITEKTKAVICVDIAGVVCDYDKAFALAERNKSKFIPSNPVQAAMGRMAVIADCAHSLGAVRNGRKTGNIADFSSFSFHAVKNLTTAEGGAATWRNIDGIDNDELYRRYQLFSLHGQSKDALAKTTLGTWEYDVVGPWYKCNMTDIAAAIGIKQLERYEDMLEIRHNIIKKYDALCDELGVEHLDHHNEYSKSSGHLYITRIPSITAEERNAIICEMAEYSIACNVHYKPLPMMTAYRNLGFDIADYPNAYEFFHNSVSLPLHSKLSDDDVQYITECYKKVLSKYIKD